VAKKIDFKIALKDLHILLIFVIACNLLTHSIGKLPAIQKFSLQVRVLKTFILLFVEYFF